MELYKNTNNHKAHIKKPPEEYKLFEGGAHFQYDEMCRTLEALARKIYGVQNQSSTTKFNEIINKNKISTISKPNFKINFGEIKNIRNSNESKNYLITDSSKKSTKNNNIILPLINANSLMNTAVTTRDLDKFKTRSTSKKTETKIKDYVNYYNIESHSQRSYSMKRKETKDILKDFTSPYMNTENNNLKKSSIMNNIGVNKKNSVIFNRNSNNLRPRIDNLKYSKFV